MRGFPAGVGGADIDRTGYLRPLACAVTGGNINLASLPATIDGLSLATGAVFWANAQTDTTEIGPWTYTGSGQVATRPAFWATGYVHKGDQLKIVGGSLTGYVLQVTTADPITVGTTVIAVDPSTPIGSVTSSDSNNIVATTVDGDTALTIGVNVWRNANVIVTPTFAGRNGAGTISVTGVAVGDTIIAVIPYHGTFPADDANFTISGANQVTQGNAINLSATSYRMILKRAS